MANSRLKNANNGIQVIVEEIIKLQKQGFLSQFQDLSTYTRLLNTHCRNLIPIYKKEKEFRKYAKDFFLCYGKTESSKKDTLKDLIRLSKQLFKDKTSNWRFRKWVERNRNLSFAMISWAGVVMLFLTLLKMMSII